MSANNLYTYDGVCDACPEEGWYIIKVGRDSQGRMYHYSIQLDNPPTSTNVEHYVGILESERVRD